MKRLLPLLLLLLTACGGGGSGDTVGSELSSPADSIEEFTEYAGIFTGSAVSGVHYRAILEGFSQEGVTAEDGSFAFFSGNGSVSEVTFSIGDIILGSLQPEPANNYPISVFDLVETSDQEAEDQAVNLYRFLRTLDQTEDTETIEISASQRAALSGIGEKSISTLSSATFDDELDEVISTLSSSGYLRAGETNLVAREAVETHILQSKNQTDAARIHRLTLTTGVETAVADGVGEVLLRATVTDVNILAIEGVRVQFQTTAGFFAVDHVQSAARLTDANGEAFVLLTAPLQAYDATVSATAGGWTETASLSFVSPVYTPSNPPVSLAGTSASIEMTVDYRHLFVQGVGKLEQAQVTMNIVDGSGNALDETAWGYGQSSNNLRVTLQSHPGGGERLTGLRRMDAAGSGQDMETITHQQQVQVRTISGEAVLHVSSGVLPGVVELKAELLDVDGVSVLATAHSSMIAIASGPAHSINLSSSSLQSMVNMSEYGLTGVYCQLGVLLVNDRYGHAVPDGTAISLGLVDTIIHEGFGYISQESNQLTMVSAQEGFESSFDAASIDVNGVQRSIQVGDRVLIPSEVIPSDRIRHVQTVGDERQLGTGSAYLNSPEAPANQSVHYFVGTSRRGGAIHGYDHVLAGAGCDPAFLTKGVTTTTAGLAPIRMTFPANRDTILTGCYTDTTTDRRHNNPRSAQVFFTATTTDGSITIVDNDHLCFDAVIPITMTATPDTLSSSSTFFQISVEDAGNIRLPFIEVACEAVIASNVSGIMDVSVFPLSGITTDEYGELYYGVEISGGGGEKADRAEINCWTTESSLTINVTVP